MLTYGFYNSLNGDRTYDAIQMCSIFDGVIRDGIFASQGDCMIVTADGEDNTIKINTGRAWFDHTWNLNDAVLPMVAPDSNQLLDRIDAVVLEINADETVRENSFKIIEGVASSSPVNPTLTNDTNVHQYPLCYIYRTADSSLIRQADITNMVGSESTPFVTGILDVISLDELLGQWEDQLNRFVEDEEFDFSEWYAEMIQKSEDAFQEFVDWGDNEKATILDWFNNLKDIIDENVAIKLELEIEKHEIENYLMIGFPDGTKEFSDDGLIIKSVNGNGWTLTKTFTADFLECEIILNDNNDGLLGSLKKTFSADGKLITSELLIV